MKKYLAIASFTALISAAPFAMAASSTDLTVTGTITPSACTPSFPDGGIIDFGKINAKDLNQTGYTELGRPRTTLSVACDGPTTFALQAIDNRPNTATDRPYFGLGLTPADEKLGHYVPWIFNVVADGLTASAIKSSNQGNSWVAAPYLAATQYLSISDPSAPTIPLAAKDVTMDLEIRTWIGRADRLTLTDEVSIDGSATFEMKYL
ncbi:DUF1120 domain-containing protein [Pseudomonas vancouverensis]|uniref:DUF1120 domain-containing protein n=1 Tax=Pseudomonas vancouverensis TaxID=95300 RepID=UPI003D026FE0